MVTETMVLIALRQKNWNSAQSLLDEVCQNNPENRIKTISCALKAASGNPMAAHLLSLWTEIRWSEINDDNFFN
ncbi:MAG TPA: hypothetical protein PKG52_02905 [bacterium]|nr:hypothetical protein [bacterium]HPS30724.1 hypothetical protein [bacterium]